MPTLNWIGKEAVVKHAAEVPTRLLEPVPELGCGDADGGGNLCERPVTNVPQAAKVIGVNRGSVTAALTKMQEMGLVRELTGNRRNRLFAYDAYWSLLSRDTVPLTN